MSSLLATKIARRRSIAFVALLAATLVMMAFSSLPATREFQGAVSFALRPIQGAVNDVAKGVSGVFSAMSDIERLHTDNAALRRENERLTAENLRTKATEQENEDLTALLQLRNSFQFKTAAAEVIARDSSEARRSVAISKGTDDEIAVGDVVIAEGGALVGRVSQVGPNFANVVLISDRSSTVIGQTESSLARGDVVGQLGGALIMENIDSTEKIMPGEQVLTAGIQLPGGIRSPYPKGLLLGEVTDIKRDANSVVQTAYLQPTADLEKVAYVLVVLDYVGGLPGPDDTPIDCSQTGTGGTLPGGEQPCIEPSASPRASPSPLLP